MMQELVNVQSIRDDLGFNLSASVLPAFRRRKNSGASRRVKPSLECWEQKY